MSNQLDHHAHSFARNRNDHQNSRAVLSSVGLSRVVFCLGFGLFFAIASLTGDRSVLGQDNEVTHIAVCDDGAQLWLGWSRGSIQPMKIEDRTLGQQLTVVRPGDLGALSPHKDGIHVAVSSKAAPTLDVWNTETKQPVKRLKLPDIATAIAFSPDGKSLVVAGQFQLTLYDWATAKILAQLPNVHQCNALTWSANSKLVGFVCEGRAAVWYPSTKKVLMNQAWPIGVGGVIQLSFSPNGRTLATRFQRDTTLWDVASGQTVLQFNESGIAVPGLAWSADGKKLITCNEEEFLIRVAPVGKPGSDTSASSEPAETLPIDVRPSVVHFSRNASVAVWMESNMRQVANLHSYTFAPPASAPPSDLASGRAAASDVAMKGEGSWTPPTFEESERKLASDPLVTRFDRKGQKPQSKPTLSAEKSQPNAQVMCKSMALSGDGKTVVVGGMDGEVFVGAAPSGRIRSRFRNSDNDLISQIAISPDSKKIALYCDDETIFVWSDTGVPIANLMGVEHIKFMKFSPSGKFFLVGGEEWLHMYDGQDFSWIQSLQFDGGYTTTVGISPDESLVAIGVTNSVYLWSINEDKLKWRVESGSLGVMGLAISPTNKKLVVDYSSPVSEVYDIESAQRIVLKDTMLEEPVFLDEERIIGADGARAFHIVSASDLTEIESIPHPSGGVNIEAYSNAVQFDDRGQSALFRGRAPFYMSDLRFWNAADAPKK